MSNPSTANSKQSEQIVEEVVQRLQEENERLGSQKTKEELDAGMNAAEQRRKALLEEKIQKAKDSARHPQDREGS